MMNKKDWIVYLVRCSDKSLYCGITNDLNRRLKAHNLGKGAKYTRSRKPVELVAAVWELTKSEALQLEHKIKHVSADKKVTELIKGKANLKMNLKKELKKVNDKISAMATLVDKLIAATEKLDEPTKLPVKTQNKKTAKTTISKKPSANKSKKKPATKKTIENATPKETATETVLGIIKESSDGINTALLTEKTGFNQKKIQNLIFKLKKQGKIKTARKGFYVAV